MGSCLKNLEHRPKKLARQPKQRISNAALHRLLPSVLPRTGLMHLENAMRYALVELVTLRKNSCRILTEGLTPLEQTPEDFTTTTTTTTNHHDINIQDSQNKHWGFFSGILRTHFF